MAKQPSQQSNIPFRASALEVLELTSDLTDKMHMFTSRSCEPAKITKFLSLWVEDRVFYHPVMSLQSKELVKCRTVLAAATIVVVGNQFNISIFTPSWLCQFGILKPEDILGGSVFTPPVVNIPTPTFQLTILPDRLQICFQDLMAASNEANANRVVGGILRQLPHTPLVAIGINLDCFLAPPFGLDFATWNKTHFASPFAINSTGESKLDARYGSYFSSDFEGMRLRIDAKPVHGVTATSPSVTEQLKTAPYWMHIGFNYQKDFQAGTATTQALETIANYAAIVNHANSMIKGWA